MNNKDETMDMAKSRDCPIWCPYLMDAGVICFDFHCPLVEDEDYEE